MRALVTGACGFVGGHLVASLLQAGDEVLGTFLQEPRDAQPLAGLERVKLDVTNAEEVRKLVERFRPEVIYHLAAIAFVPEAENDFDRVLKINVGATYNICQAAHLLNTKITIVLVSSAEIYGRVSAEHLPISEELPLLPMHNYGLTKVMSEQVVQKFTRAGTIRSVILRPFNHIGPGQDPRFVASSFAKQVAEIEAGLVPAVIKVGNLDARRDFSDVRDIVRAYRFAAIRGEGIYNLGSGRSIKVKTLLDELCAMSKIQVKVEIDPDRYRPIDVPDVFGSVALAARELNWVPQISVRQSLADALEWWRKRVVLGNG